MSQPAWNNPRDAETTHEQGAGQASEAVNAGALDEIVRATLETTASDESATSHEIAALRAVAVRHGRVPLATDPIAIDLVEAMILVNYGQLRRPPELWRSIAGQIATTLMESPAARARLENLWARLLELHGSPVADA